MATLLHGPSRIDLIFKRAELARRISCLAIKASEFDPSKHPRGEHGLFRSKEERTGAIEKLKLLSGQMKSLGSKGGLTSREAEAFKKVSQEVHDLRYQTARPTIPHDKFPSAAERLSTLTPEIINTARGDLLSNRHVYDAVVEAAAGVHFNLDTPVDQIMNGEDPQVSPEDFYNTFAATRASLRQAFGDEIMLYRATGAQKSKKTTNWATTKAFAAQFGSNVISQSISVDRVLAVNVGTGTSYHELIVGDPPGTRSIQASEFRPADHPRDTRGQFAPSGRIKHAVLVIGGKRYRGPSHFQALMAYAAENPNAPGLPKIQQEGFETESGHFLDREEAAEYAMAKGQVSKYAADSVERTGRLASEDMIMQARGGKLYTQDEVQAKFNPGQERDNRGRWVSGVAIDTTQNLDISEKLLVRIVSDYFPTDKIMKKFSVVKPGTLGTFQVEGKTYHKGGHWDKKNREVVAIAHPDVLSHELGHAEFDHIKELAFKGLEEARDKHTSGGGIESYGATGFLTFYGAIEGPVTPYQKLYNALIDFVIIHSKVEHLPSDYAKSWAKEKVVDHFDSGIWLSGTNIASELSTHCSMHEAYAEYSAGRVNDSLIRAEYYTKAEVGRDRRFKRMDGPEGREAFKNLRKALLDAIG